MPTAIRVGISLVAMTTLTTACFEATNSRIVRVDDSQGALEPALMEFTRPRVFGRDSSIADRVRENNFLEDRLDNTAKETFGSQVMRDLEVVRTLSGQFGISFDPLGKQSIANAMSLNDLQQQIDVVKMQAELFRVKKAYDDLQQGSGQGPAAPGTVQSPKPSTRSVDTSKITEALANLEKNLKAPERSQRSGATPELTLRDQLAYRAEIRSAIAGNALDDTHDVSGNTLYRLSLRVEVLPGNEAQRKRWGFARLVIQNRTPTREEIKELYYDWIAYLDSKLAAASLDYNVRNNTLRDLVLLQKATKYFDLVPVQDDKGRCYFKASVPETAKSAEGLELLDAGLGTPKPAANCVSREILVRGAEGDRWLPVVPKPLAQPAKPTPKGGKEKDPQPPQQTIQDFFDRTQRAREEGYVPEAFIKFVEDEERNAAARVYSTLPVIRDQRMSSISSVLSAVQLAAGVSAALPSTGAGLEAGIGAANKAAGRIDAIERIPSVISLSGETNQLGGTSPRPWAAWILGPQVLIRPGDDKEEVELRHSPMPHEVGMDIAIPAWRRSLDIDAQTVWIGAWTDKDSNVLKKLDEEMKGVLDRRATALEQNSSIPELPDQKNGLTTKRFSIELAPTETSLAALTRRMKHRHRVVGLTRPAIFRVTPDSFKSCEGPVSFTIHGENLWRRPEVYLDGVRSETPHLLPDMDALNVVFEGKNFAGRVGSNARLEVFTREGSVTALRNSDGMIRVDKCDADPANPPTQTPGKPPASPKPKPKAEKGDGAGLTPKPSPDKPKAGADVEKPPAKKGG